MHFESILAVLYKKEAKMLLNRIFTFLLSLIYRHRVYCRYSLLHLNIYKNT